ncbi:hypothetical protein MKW98_014048 [Papaver atlanticum]|uniref:3'-5' exonuclease domain-containing protein n=1 Tax=Papaver atlanticum TaxID=357466 RepID=A0AAD4SII6_9MAGN|nr:hypothetical protein MKW98_014048 [Papaver atlanticum]
MGGSSVHKEIMDGLAGVSLDDKKKSDQMSSRSNVAEDKVSSIELDDKSSTHQTYNVVLFHENKDKKPVRTTVTHSASVVDQWIASVYTDFRNKLKNLVVGLDIEWSRKSRDGYSRNKVAVLQLCFSTRCLIFQISRCDEIPESLADFLSNESFIFVGAGIDGDAHKLWVDYGLYVGRTEEVGTLAAYKLTKTFLDYRNSGLYNAGLKNLAKDVLGLELPKERKIQTSNWNVGFLNEQQIEYACLDALATANQRSFLGILAKKKTEEEPKQDSEKANGTKGKQEAKQVPEKKANETKSRRP